MKSIRKSGVSRLIPILCVASVVVAAVVACTGSDPAPAGPIAPGELGGDCFVNSTCNPGLVCTTIDGNAKCANPSNTSSSSGSSGSSGTSGIVEAGHDAPIRCVFEPTSFVCKELARCYGEPLDAGSDADAEVAAEDAGADCVGKDTACDPGQLRWECNSGHYCSAKTCCITATVTRGAGTCGESNLQIDDAGSICAREPSCPSGATKLCQVNEDCADDELCRPVRVFGPPSIQGTIVGACISSRK